MFVADFYNDRVQKFAPDGTFLTPFGETGDGPGQIRHAMAVDVADDGAVFVADFLNNRVQIMAAGTMSPRSGSSPNLAAGISGLRILPRSNHARVRPRPGQRDSVSD